MRTLGTWQSSHGPSWLVDFTSVDEQLRFLRKLVEKYRQSPMIRDLAVKTILDAGCPMKDKRSQALAIGTWVQDNIYYVLELPERFATPEETLRAKAGDCDDMTTLTGAMLESIGIPSLLVAMKIDYRLSHIFPGALMPSGKLLPLDSTLKFPVRNVVNPCDHAKSKGKRVSLKIV